MRYKFAFQWCEEQGTPWWLIPRSVSRGPCAEPEAMNMAEETKTVTSRHPARDISSLLNNCEPSGDYIIESEDSFERDPASVPQNPVPSPSLAGTLTISARCADGGPVSRACPVCKNSSPMVYAEGWMCLHRKCSVFWRNAQGHPPNRLTYAKSFLQPVPFAPEALQDLRPSLPAKVAEDGITTTSMFSKGWHCLRCGRLSCRYRWEHWHCKNCGVRPLCSFTLHN